MRSGSCCRFYKHRPRERSQTMTRAPGIGNRRVSAVSHGRLAALVLVALFLSATAEAQQFDYSAVLAYPGHINGPVNAGGIVWQCNTKYCTTRGPWPVPGIKSCNALAAIVGQLASYGYKGRMLSPNDMATCNGRQANATNQAPANSQTQPGQQSANQSSAAINPLGALFQNLANANGGNSGNGNSNNSGSSGSSTPPPGSTPPASTPAPSASPSGPVTIRTAELTATGTGVLAARLPFSPLRIRTASLRATGTGALAASLPFSPITIRTMSLSVTGTGSP